MGVNTSFDIELDDEYVLGLIDHCTRPSLEPYQTKGSYGLNTTLHISPRQSEILVGIISQFLDIKHIEYRYDRRDSKGVPGKIIISDNSSIIKLHNIGSGVFIQIAERIEYLNSVIQEYEGKTIAGQEKLFYKLFKPWDDMHPHWESKKYTIDFFENKFGIRCIEDSFDTPDPDYPDSISTEYVTGAFDGSGMISLKIGEEPGKTIGYGMSIGARITMKHPDIRLKPYFIQYFQNHGLEPSISERDDRLEIRFSSVDGVEQFIEKVGGNTMYLYSLCELFYSQLIPAFEDQYHTRKEGFFDMLQVYEEIAPERRRKKYTVEYFREEWNFDV